MSRSIHVNLDWLIYRLLCGYAFFIPLEHILEVYFQIDTVLKPYRALAILIILSFVLRSCFRWYRNPELNEDKFLYSIFLYGIFITFVRMITNVFDQGLLMNDAFQISLYVGVFIVIRHMNLSRDQVLRVYYYLVAGIITNSIYVFYKHNILRLYGRNAGFMDNPNYLALSVAVVIVFLILKLPELHSLMRKVLVFVTILFLCYILVLSGSRTGFALMMMSLILMLYFSSLKLKAFLMAFLLGIGVFFSLYEPGQFAGTGQMALLNRLEKNSGEDNRIPIWKGVLRAAEATNFSGLGVGQFKGRFGEFYEEENNQLIRAMTNNGYYLSPHSDYFALLAIYGIIGLVCYLIYAYLSVLKVFRKYRNAPDVDSQRYYQFGFLMIVSLLLFGLTNENFVSPMFWIVLSLSTRTYFIERDNNEQEYNL